MNDVPIFQPPALPPGLPPQTPPPMPTPAEPGIGHNSGLDADMAAAEQKIAQDRPKRGRKPKEQPEVINAAAQAVKNEGGELLLSYLERVERLQEEVQGLNSDIKEIKFEAKNKGFDMPAFNEVLRRRKMKADKRTEFEQMVITYMHSIGME